MGLARLVGSWWWLLAAPAFVALPRSSPSSRRTSCRRTASTIRSLGQPSRSLEAAGAHRPQVRSGSQNVSDHTSAPNAYTVGFGPSRRVMIWDTLLDGRFTPGEVRVVSHTSSAMRSATTS